MFDSLLALVRDLTVENTRVYDDLGDAFVRGIEQGKVEGFGEAALAQRDADAFERGRLVGFAEARAAA
jgi:hypothetical protein